MVFQDPFSSLNPAYRVSHGILRGLKLHRPRPRARRAAQREAERVLEAVGLNPAAEILDRYPYELSGGQRQRIGFAQALAYRPKLILADEPVSMLDVSIRIGLLNLMAAAARATRACRSSTSPTTSRAPATSSDRLLVMYAGHIVESGPTEEVLARPQASVHPVTAVGRAGPASAAGRDRRDRQGRAAQGHRPDAGLPVPGAVPARRRRVRERTPGARRVVGTRHTRPPATWPRPRRPPLRSDRTNGKRLDEDRGRRWRVSTYTPGAGRRDSPAGPTCCRCDELVLHGHRRGPAGHASVVWPRGSWPRTGYPGTVRRHHDLHDGASTAPARC